MNKRESLFWEKVGKGKSDECWEWRAGCFSNGYGEFRNGERRVRAHRFSWELENGTIPDGMCILHHCDNPKCVNPSHLWLGTNADNSQDMVDKNRQAHLIGEANGQSKLTKEEVLQIRLRYATGSVTQKELAKKHHVDPANISYIINHKSWKHI